ncbi:MAG: hypothetical protein IJS04_04150 [Muribaculaceae bacterium]|nr:hypothetical protein [Muribaculaceae bacterium]
MSCGCENKRKAGEYERMAGLAKKAAILNECVMEFRQKEDGTYTFNCLGTGGTGKIIEYFHYL